MLRATAFIVILANASSAFAQDWPQWRGPNRDGIVTGFTAPSTWPNALKQQWKVAVGYGVATPALVGGKLYVFARQGGNEVLRCLVLGPVRRSTDPQDPCGEKRDGSQDSPAHDSAAHLRRYGSAYEP